MNCLFVSSWLIPLCEHGRLLAADLYVAGFIVRTRRASVRLSMILFHLTLLIRKYTSCSESYQLERLLCVDHGPTRTSKSSIAALNTHDSAAADAESVVVTGGDGGYNAETCPTG